MFVPRYNYSRPLLFRLLLGVSHLCRFQFIGILFLIGFQSPHSSYSKLSWILSLLCLGRSIYGCIFMCMPFSISVGLYWGISKRLIDRKVDLWQLLGYYLLKIFPISFSIILTLDEAWTTQNGLKLINYSDLKVIINDATDCQIWQQWQLVFRPLASILEMSNIMFSGLPILTYNIFCWVFAHYGETHQ